MMPCPGGHGAGSGIDQLGTVGIAQCTLSGRAASPQGPVSFVWVLPQPKWGALSLSWVYLFPWCSSHTLGELPSLSRWQTQLVVLWGAHPGHTVGPWAPLLHTMGQQEQGGSGVSVKLCHTPKEGPWLLAGPC